MTQPQRPWHADEGLLTAYLDGDTSPALAASVEQHVVRCAQCRGAVRTLSDPAPLVGLWDRIVVDIVSPQPTRLERALRRVGLADRDVVLVRSAPAVRGAWLLGIMLCLTFAVIAAASGGSYGSLLFMWTAPLVPVLAVAMAFGSHADPGWELAVASPSSPVRLVLLRAGAVVASALPLSALAGAVLPGSPWASIAWLLPSLAGVALTLAAATWLPVAHAAFGVAAAWFTITGAVAAADEPATARVSSALLAAGVLPAYVVIAVVAGCVFVMRSDHLSHLGDTP